jgi:hypothetical protein
MTKPYSYLTMAQAKDEHRSAMMGCQITEAERECKCFSTDHIVSERTTNAGPAILQHGTWAPGPKALVGRGLFDVIRPAHECFHDRPAASPSQSMVSLICRV